MDFLEYKYIYDIYQLMEIKDSFKQRIDFINEHKDMLNQFDINQKEKIINDFNVLSSDGITQLERLIKKDNINSSEQFIMVFNTINKINATISNNVYRYLVHYKGNRQLKNEINRNIKEFGKITYKLENYRLYITSILREFI